MKTSKIIAAAALSMLAAAGVQAETYQGVHSISSNIARAEVKAQAVVAAHSADPYAEGASSRIATVPSGAVARATVRSDAVVAAHSANPYAEGYGQGVTPVPAGSAERVTVRAQARAVAHGVGQLPL
ncbi:helicase SNF2 [Variovorax guangxiensis]|uniref:helicase SNF2 n=1 Tax=Variovorax guangxiensis TaxID=1775474 RepID=UPI00285A8FE5|nr:helicase SNF2 [Variovorax guangxiensis]MDR6858498.1 hypothetical protein [Variovorax guangxiensis]